MIEIKPRERSRILKCLKVGVVPTQGIHYLQVGRSDEVSAIIEDLKLLNEAVNCFRVFIGMSKSHK